MSDVVKTIGKRPNIARTLARLQTVQTLFIKQAQNCSHQQALLEFMASTAVQTHADHQYTRTLVLAAAEYEEEITLLISARRDKKRRAPDSVMSAILTAGITELLTQLDISTRIIINEYVDITHSFYEGKEAGFINSMLDSIAKNVRQDVERDAAQYRPCVGIVLLNKNDQVFTGKRIDTQTEAWQMPQGGIDEDETVERALFREMLEETGTDKASIIKILPDWYFYDLPKHLQGKLWGGNFIGQRQRWVICQFEGEDSDINIATEEPEFCEWQWQDIDNIPEVIVPFKKALYRQVIRAVKKALHDDSL